jgi:streptomycin 6-kinase
MPTGVIASPMIDPAEPELLAFVRRYQDDAGFKSGLRIAEELIRRWQLSFTETIPGANYCLVFGVKDAEDRERVLRVPLSAEERGSGYYAQLAFSGSGGVTVYRHDEPTGSTLMTRLRPGAMLSDAGLDAKTEVEICCGVIRSLDCGATQGAAKIADWYMPFFAVNETEGIPRDLLHQAQSIADRLLATTAKGVLLHGDLHHFNLLSHGNEWFAIDPKGVIGDPALEPAAFIRNPCTTIRQVKDLPALMRTRIQCFAEGLGLPTGRIWEWAFAHNVLSAWWDDPAERWKTIEVVEAILEAK